MNFKQRENEEITSLISGIYILDKTGALIFTYDIFKQGSNDNKLVILSHFLYALQSAASQLPAEQIKTLEMGNNRYFMIKELTTNFLFILKTIREADLEKITPILKEITLMFKQKLLEHPHPDLDEKMQIYASFKEDINNYFKGDTNLNIFLKDL